MGNIKAILSDNGTQFHSKKTLNQYNIKILHTTTYHPERNTRKKIMHRIEQRDRGTVFPKYVPGPKILIKNHQLSSGEN